MCRCQRAASWRRNGRLAVLLKHSHTYRTHACRDADPLRHCTGTCLHLTDPASTVHIIIPSPCSSSPHFISSSLSSSPSSHPSSLLCSPASLVTPRYDLMGNFVSSSCSASSRPTTTPSPPPPPPPTSPPSPPSPPPPPEHRKHRCALTSALATHAARLANLFRWSGRIRLDDIDKCQSLPADDVGARGPHADADVPNGRRRALLIGIAYHGELLNTHKDVDRYRDVLLGTPERRSSLFPICHLFYCLSLFYCLNSLLFPLLSIRRHVWVPRGGRRDAQG